MILNLTGNSNDFTIEFNPSLKFTSQMECALYKLNCWYSWYNISASKGNNTLRYNNGAIWTVVTIPDGQYTIDQINDYLQLVMFENGDYSGGTPPEFFITLSANFSTLRTSITLTNSYQIDLSVSTLNELLGWDSAIYNFTGTQDGQSIANINDSINNLVIKTDLIDPAFSYDNNFNQRTLYTFVPNTIPGTNIEIAPITKIYIPLQQSNGEVRSVRMQILDNLGRDIDFNGEPVSYLLHIKKKIDL